MIGKKHFLLAGANMIDFKCVVGISFLTVLLATTASFAATATATSALTPSTSTPASPANNTGPASVSGANLGLTPMPDNTKLPAEAETTKPDPYAEYLIEGANDSSTNNGGTVSAQALKSKDQVANEEATAELLSKGIVVKNYKPNPEAEKLRKWALEEDQKAHARPPTFFEDNDLFAGVDMSPYRSEILPIALNTTYFWKEKDADALADILGIKAADIPKNCFIRLQVQVNTDKHTAIKRFFPGDELRVNYNGTINNITISPWAVCKKPSGKIPQKSNLIGKVGADKYSISVDVSGVCPGPKTKEDKYLDITYKGNGEYDCKYYSTPAKTRIKPST